MRERELKRRDDGQDIVVIASLPMRERELKLEVCRLVGGLNLVAPHAGA